MTRSSLLPLLFIPLMACRTGGSAEQATPAEMTELDRLAAAGSSNIRAAYTLYSLAHFDLQLALLETLPRAWFLGTAEMEEAIEFFEQNTGIEAPATAANDSAAFALASRRWLDWWRARRGEIHEARREEWDPRFGRLMATSPFLESDEFRTAVRSLGALSGREPSWGRGDRYPSWAAFEADLHGWRAWFESNRDRLEYDNLTGRLVIGRGVGEHTH